jgi:hypothetical protein
MSYPLPTTPNDIINLAMKMSGVLGVGQSPSAEDTNDAFNLMTMMMAQWQTRRYMVFQIQSHELQATGAISYTVGPGGDFDIPRPQLIESGFFRMQASSDYPVDYPFAILRAREDYDRVSLKTLNAFPQYLYYDAGTPLGTLYVWPVANNQYSLHITTRTPIQSFETIYDEIVLPNEYKAALMWGLAEQLYPMYSLPTDAAVAAKASAALRVIKDANTQLPRLRMPSVLNSRGGTYNIYGDYNVGNS